MTGLDVLLLVGAFLLAAVAWGLWVAPRLDEHYDARDRNRSRRLR